MASRGDDQTPAKALQTPAENRAQNLYNPAPATGEYRISGTRLFLAGIDAS